MALRLLRQHKSMKLVATNKRNKATRNRDYLLRIRLLPVEAE